MHTVQRIFEAAILLMDAQNSASGAADTPENREYRLRTPALLNTLLDRCCPGELPLPRLAAMTDTVPLDARICDGVLPYGLAALLLAEENAALAAFFWQTFQEQLTEALRTVPAEIEPVEDVYGGIDCRL